MPVCPVCRQSFDARFQVFVPPHYDAFDSIACARRASQAWGHRGAPMPVLLPPLEMRTAFRTGRPRLRRLGLVASALALSPAPAAAVAAGMSLVAAGTTASVYLWRGSGGPGATPEAGSRLHPAPHGQSVHRPTLIQPLAPLPTGPAPASAATPKAGGAHTASTKKEPQQHASATPKAPAQTPSAHTELAAVVTPPQSTSSHSSGHAGQEARSGSAGHGAGAQPSHRPATPKPKHPAPQVPRTKPHATHPKPAAPKPNPAPKAPSGGSTPPTAAPQEAPSPTSRPAPPTQTPVPSSPTPAPQPTDQTPPSSQRPGNGWGDPNHDHTGPPGQDQGGNGNGHGNGHGH